MLKKILRGAGGDAIKYFPVRLVPALTSLITVPVFTHAVDPTDYGNFYLVNSMTSLAAVIATGWLTTTAVRFYWAYQRKEELDSYVSTIVWSTVASLLAVSGIAGLLVLMLPNMLNSGVKHLLPIGFIALFANSLVQVLQQIMRAANRPGSYATLAVASNLLATGFGVYFVSQGNMGAYGILLGVVIGNVLLLPFGLKNAHSEGSIAPTSFSRGALDEFARFGFPMVPAALSSWALVLSDRYVIGLTRSASEVGVYAVAYGLGDKIMNLIVAPLLMTMGPVIVMTFEKEGHDLAQRVQTQFTRYFLLATLPLLAGLTALSKEFMQVFTGQAYQAAYAVLPVVSAGVLFNGLTQIAGNGVALHKKTTIIMTNTLVAAAFQITANLLLVPRFGYPVAAWTTLASYVVFLTLTWTRSRPYMAWHIPWADVARVFGAAASMGVLVSLTFGRLTPSFPMLLAAAASGLAGYGVLLLLFGAVRADERAFVIEGVGRLASRLRRRR